MEKLKIEYVKISELRPNPKNPRKMTKGQLNKLKRSIKEFGFKDPVIVNKHPGRENIIIGGHMRTRASKELGFEKLPVVYVDLPADKEHLLNIALNVGGDWDDKKLFDLLLDLNNKGADLTLTCLEEPFIDEIIEANKDRLREDLIDVAPAVPEKPKTKPGDIFLLGDHRLMCGDSTNPEDFKKLMQDKKADTCWTDPPYGVSYKGTNNPNGRDWKVMKNDELRGDALYKLLSGIFLNVAKYTKDNPAIYCCYASTNHKIFEKALNDAGIIIKQQLIWSKGHVLGHSDYHWSHEPILYCRKKENNCAWIGDRTHKTLVMNSTVEDLEDLKKAELIQIIQKIREDSDILKIKKDPSIEYMHSTQKPVELSKSMIRNNTGPKGLVVEPCGGSGSTLIACESSQRTCYCMELDPKYCDVILMRWAEYTSQDPVRLQDNKKWSEIKSS